MRRRTLWCPALVLRPAVAGADSWPGPLTLTWPGPMTLTRFSTAGDFFVRITPGTSVGGTRGFAGAPKGAYARARFSGAITYHPGQVKECVPPEAVYVFTDQLGVPIPAGPALLAVGVTTVIDSLEREALVTRRRDPAHRRKTTIDLSAKGRTLIQRALTPAEQDELGRLCKKLGLETPERQRRERNG